MQIYGFPMNRTIPLSVPEDLLEEIQETARITHLSVQDVFRESVRIAAPKLRESFGETPESKQLSGWDALRGGRKHFGGELKITPIPGKIKKVTL